jgi:hypothetical protein
LATRRKADPVKIALARRLRQETTMPLKWICDQLNEIRMFEEFRGLG